MENWDKDGNWIGDEHPDSTMDWGVDYQKDVESGTFLLGVGFFFGMAFRIAIFAAPIVLIVWLTLVIAGVL